MKGKKGAEYLTIWWFFCVVVVFVSIVATTLRFQYVADVSELDAGILANRVLDCVVQNGNLIFEVNNLGNSDILSLCKIEFRPGKDYFVGIELYNLSACTQSSSKEQVVCYILARSYISSQNPKLDLMDRCINLENVRASNMPKCSYQSTYALKDGQKYVIRAIGGTYER